MNCPPKTGEGAEVFIAYTARTLPAETEEALQQHLKECADCRRTAQAQCAVWSALDAWSPAAVSSNFDEKLYARIAAEAQKPWWRRVLSGNLDRGLSMDWSWKPAMPVAAACAALLAAFVLQSPVPEHQAQVGVQPKVDIEQVERALDDIDMLKQLGLAAVFPPDDKPVHSATM
jgi:Putative zinc-finger